MRRLFAILLIAIFVFTVWLGFDLAATISHAASQIVVQAAPADQINWLYLSLAGSDSGNPHPSSAWIALFRKSPTPVLIFKKLYPLSSTLTEWAEIQKSYQAGSTQEVPARLEARIAELQLSIRGNIVLDRGHIPTIAAIAGISPSVMPKFITSDESLLDTATMQAICQVLTSDLSLRPLSKAQKSWMDPWKGLVTSLRFSSCEVLVDP